MDFIYTVFGKGDDISALQCLYRAIVLFFVCLALVRFSGRRAFGIHTAFDNVTAILLGSVVSEGIIGSAEFIPTLVAASAISVLHRFSGLLAYHSKMLGRLLKGRPLKLYENGSFHEDNMRRCQITRHDVMEAVRERINEESLDNVHTVFAERNGAISVLKKIADRG